MEKGTDKRSAYALRITSAPKAEPPMPEMITSDGLPRNGKRTACAVRQPTRTCSGRASIEARMPWPIPFILFDLSDDQLGQVERFLLRIARRNTHIHDVPSVSLEYVHLVE